MFPSPLGVLGLIREIHCALFKVSVPSLNRPGMSGDSSSWKGWGHVRWFIEEVPAGAA
ncbi:MmpS family membrane protein [Mycobacterium tuberculosis]|nr:MmpS family membrane protein [Mycobacterium tuberculosis]CFI56846.1 MmpS family membrane protein [Mycobacterium tuberculosis]CLN11296.1 MmpS family membrane protein [Mycobacterium tuberculosis]CLN51973.1 MmpS family membrane protein [Mycobacterium tuberculosis]CLP47303.1 MmpS family membrane protein [Mycobacterium tuberculosis]